MRCCGLPDWNVWVWMGFSFLTVGFFAAGSLINPFLFTPFVFAGLFFMLIGVWAERRQKE